MNLTYIESEAHTMNDTGLGSTHPNLMTDTPDEESVSIPVIGWLAHKISGSATEPLHLPGVIFNDHLALALDGEEGWFIVNRLHDEVVNTSGFSANEIDYATATCIEMTREGIPPSGHYSSRDFVAALTKASEYMRSGVSEEDSERIMGVYLKAIDVIDEIS